VKNFLKNEDNRALFWRSWLLENDWGHKIRAMRAPGGDNPTLCIAAVCGLQLITQKLIASGASVSSRSVLSGWTPLHCAAASPCEEISGKLLRAGARIDDRTDKSKNAAHLAGNVQVFGILVESGADVNSMTNRGDTALHYAAQQGNAEIVKLLIEKNANVNVEEEGQRALMIAAHGGHSEIVKILLNANADVDVQNWLGSTALIDAARDGHAEIVKMLLDAKADVGRQSLWGDTALNMAKSRGHTPYGNC